MSSIRALAALLATSVVARLLTAPPARSPELAVPPSVTAAPIADAAGGAERRDAARTAHALVAEYFGVDTAALSESPALHAVTRIRTLVVVLPDPLDSRLDWLYDSGLESVRRALERDRYVLDRFWLPWTIDAEQARHGPHDPSAVGLRATTPGVLVFRSSKPEAPTELAVVWVVGESPTAGVHRAAFDAALAERDALLGLCSSGASAGDATVLRVVGPIFSGSIASLRGRLDAWLAVASTRRAVVVSGGATGGRNRAIMTRDEPRIAFQATVNPVDSLTSVLRTALHDRFGIPPQQVAYITESNTAYGIMAAGGQVDSRAATATMARADSAPLQIPFPMSISRLRAEYARRPAAAPPLAVPVPGAAPPSRIPLELEDPASATENLPLLSELTAPAIERTLDDIAQTLLAHKIRAVVIVATDVRDRLFIADEVKQRLRDIKLALVGTHALYSRHEVNESLRGALVTSTYPLFLEGQYWDRSQFAQRRREVFTSDLSEGTYNAALLQIGRARDMTDYAVPGDTGRMLRPPVWLTLVGRTGLVPLAAFRLHWRDSLSAETGACTRVIHQDASAPRAGDSELFVAPRCDPATLAQLDAAARRDGGIEPSVLQLGVDDLAATLTVLLVFVAAMLLVRASAVAPEQPLAGPLAIPGGVGIRAEPPPVGAPRSVAPLAPRDTPTGELATVPPGAGVAWWSAIRRLFASAPWPPLAQNAARWRHHGATLKLHVCAWSILRAVAIVAIFAPLLLTLLRPRVHAVAVPDLYPALAELLLAGGLLSLAWPHASRFPRLLRGVTRVRPDGAAGALAPAPEDTAEAAMSALVAVAVVGGAAAYLVTSAIFVLRVLLLDDRVGPPFLSRYLQWFSGVSPVMPLALGGALLLAWGTWHLRRTTLLGQAHAFETTLRAGCTPLPDPRARLIGLTPGRSSMVTFGLLTLLGVYVAIMVERSPEAVALGPLTTDARRAAPLLPGAFDLLYRSMLVILLWSLGWGLVRLVSVWGALRARLRRLADATWVEAIGRLPEPVTRLTRLTPFGGAPVERVNDVLDVAALERWRRMHAADAARTDELFARMTAAAGDDIPRLETLGPPRLRVPLAELRSAPRIGVAVDELLAALSPEAPAPTAASAPASAPAPAADGPARLVPRAESRDLWRRHAQELVALYAVDWVEWVVRHLRNLALFQLVALAIGAFLLPSYPFEPQTVVKSAFFLLMATTVAALLVVLVQMNRDEVLSRVARTALNRVSWDIPFVLNLVVVALVPTLSVLGAQFPEVREFLFSWVTPVLKAFGRG